MDGQFGVAQNGKGFEYQIGGIVGTDFADGTRQYQLGDVHQRPQADAAEGHPFYRDLWANPNTTAGTFFFIPRPGISGLALRPAGRAKQRRLAAC